MENLDGAEVTVKYFGPLEQIQQRQFKTQGINQSLAAIIPLSQIKPDVLDVVNMDQAVKELLDAHNAPQEMINDEDEIVGIRQQRAQQQAAMMQMQMAQQSMKPVDPNKAPEDGSIMAEQGAGL